MKFLHFSIIRKLLAFSTFYNILAITIFLSILIFAIQPKLEEQSSIEIHLTAENIISKLQKDLTRAEVLARSMAKTAEMFSNDEEADKKVFLHILEQSKENDYIAGGGFWPEPYAYDKTRARASFFWGKNEKNEFVFYDDYNSNDGVFYHHENWYVPSKYTSKNRAFWSQSYIDPYSKEPMVTVTVPVYNGDHFKGVTTVDVSLKGLDKLFTQETKDFNGYAFLTDRDGKILSYPDGSFNDIDELSDTFIQFKEIKNEIYKHMQEDIQVAYDSDLHKNIMNEIQGIDKEDAARISTIVNDDYKNKAESSSFQIDDKIINDTAQAYLIELKELHWKLVVVMPQSYMYRNISETYYIAIFTILIIFIALFSLYYFTFKKVLASPINRMVNELSEEADAKNSRQYLSVIGNDEFATLTEHFNSKTKLLYQAQEQLSHTNKLIEHEVKIKTASLEEEKATFETLFNESSDGMILIRSRRFIKCNQAAVDLLKYESKEVLLKTHPFRLNPEFQVDGESSHEKAKRILAKVLRKGFYSFEWTYLKADGSSVTCDVSLTSIIIDGQIVLHAILRDITQQLRLKKEMQVKSAAYKHLAETLEDQVEERTEDLAYAVRAKSDFLANMSHEIRTPMNAILGFIDILSKSEVDVQRVEQFNLIKESGNSLLAVINDILDFSKIESGKFSIENEVFKTRDPFTQIVHLYEEKAQEKDISVILNIEDSLPQHAQGDALRIKQVITNLLGNAIKFTQEGGEIKINVTYLKDSNSIKFIIEDNGIGIKKDHIDKIFSAFEQEDISTTRKYGGTGLGLTICSDLIKLMNGEIEVSSTEGKGTIFECILPIFNTNIVVEDTIEEIECEEEVEQYLGDVLVVEDNKANQMLMKLLLLDRGLVCDIAEDGHLGVKAVQDKNYDLILMDENMPNMNGIEATKHIRELGKQIPIVAVTANALKGDKDRFLSIGMNDYIPKPIDNKELDRVLNRYLKQSS